MVEAEREERLAIFQQDMVVPHPIFRFGMLVEFDFVEAPVAGGILVWHGVDKIAIVIGADLEDMAAVGQFGGVDDGHLDAFGGEFQTVPFAVVDAPFEAFEMVSAIFFKIEGNRAVKLVARIKMFAQQLGFDGVRLCFLP